MEGGAGAGGGARRRMEPKVPGLGLEAAAEWPSLSGLVSIEPKKHSGFRGSPVRIGSRFLSIL